MPEPWRQLGSKIVFDDPWYTVRADVCEVPGGHVVDGYLVAVRKDFALIAAVTEDEQLVLVRQWKQGIGEVTLELPGGIVDEGDPGAAAARELVEETGYAADAFVPLGGGPLDPSKETNRVHYFLARPAERRFEQELEPTEQIEVELVELGEALSLVRAGTIDAPTSVAGIYLALDALGRL